MTTNAENERKRRPVERGKLGGRISFLSVRVTADERRRIKAAAQASGLSVGTYLRREALKKAGKGERRAPSLEIERLALAVAAMNKVGSNLNQIARAVNTASAYDRAEAERVLGELSELVSIITAAMGRGPRA